MSENPVEKLMGIGSEQAAFPGNSRYHNVGTREMEGADGRTIKFLQRRFAPHPEELVLMHEHRVKDGDRLDRLATKYLGDPTLFWRIADANFVLRPDGLLKPAGRMLQITLPEGIGK